MTLIADTIAYGQLPQGATVLKVISKASSVCRLGKLGFEFLVKDSLSFGILILKRKMSLSNAKRRLQLIVSQQSQKKFKKIVVKMSEILRILTKK